ncbi:MAG: tetratricopeptide repeat protein [Saprospiraceae bacterium]|nr:tetratricopeptide repeat protein [Saprospiraceae bacterium]
MQSFEADQDQLLEAVEHFNKCLEIEANNARVYVGKALAANLQSDFTDALAYLQRAKEIAPNDAHIHLVEASTL